MSLIRFRYSPLPGLPKSTLKPLIPITLSYNDNLFPTFALVDSGADNASISLEVAETLGIEWRKIPPFGGFSISNPFKYHPIQMRVKILNNEFLIVVNIIEGTSVLPCVLGQEDLFKCARIVFEGYREVFEISFR